MAEANGLNPSFLGKVTALGFATPVSGAMVHTVTLNGVLPVNIFGTTNGFAGSLRSIKIIPSSAATANITLTGGVGGTLLRMLKSATFAVTGSVLGFTFSSDGTLFAFSDQAADVSVLEVVFSAT